MTDSTKKPIPLWFLSFVLLPFILVGLMIGVGHANSPQLGEQLLKMPTVLYLNTLGYLIGVAIVAVLLRRRGMRLADLGVKAPDSVIEEIVWAVGFTFVATFIVFFIAQALAQALGLAASAEGAPVWQPGLETFGVFIGPVLLAAFLNEVLFRGLLMTTLATRLNVWLVVIISTIVFGLLQLNYSSADGTLMIYYFLWSLGPAILFALRKNIWGPFLVHFFNNLWGLILVGMIFG